MKKPKIVVIGGGTGTFVVLSGLKDYPVQLSAIVAMTDSGGSTGKLIDQLGVLPPGDLRQALVALSESDYIWRKLFTYRFDNGDLKGHNFGNIFISALEKITGSTEKALHFGNILLQTKGSVIPVTLQNAVLAARYKNGKILIGESLIDSSLEDRGHIKDVFIEPRVTANPKAIEAIKKADYIIFGPGDLYTSVIPNFLVNGVAAAIKRSRAKKMYFVNAMTKLGQTNGFKASDFVSEIVKYCDGTKLDFIFVNKSKPPYEILEKYKKNENAELVVDDLDNYKYRGTKIIRANLLSKATHKQNFVDNVKRSLIRHDPDKIARVVMQVVWG